MTVVDFPSRMTDRPKGVADWRRHLIGEAPAFRAALDLAHRFAPTRLPILLIGETGTGKELFAQEIHARSGLRGSLVDVNCGALPRDMVESLLFGHRRGAFTGAVESSRGLIEEANHGTLFLDEVLSMPLGAQATLLRVLETGEVRVLGETSKRKVNLRVVSAAQESVHQMMADRTFRTDLLQRLAGVVIRIPALADRADDVVHLAEHFAALHECTLAPGVAGVLHGYDWPGNVRELKLVIERACLLSDAYEISPRLVAESIALGAMLPSPPFQTRAKDGREQFTPDASLRDRVLVVCAANGWNAARSARALGVGRTTFFRQLRALGISLRECRTSLELRVQRSGR